MRSTWLYFYLFHYVNMNNGLALLSNMSVYTYHAFPHTCTHNSLMRLCNWMDLTIRLQWMHAPLQICRRDVTDQQGVLPLLNGAIQCFAANDHHAAKYMYCIVYTLIKMQVDWSHHARCALCLNFFFVHVASDAITKCHCMAPMLESLHATIDCIH